MLPDADETGNRIAGRVGQREGSAEEPPAVRPRKRQRKRRGPTEAAKRRGRLKEAPVTRSKGGWRRKPRRMTPATIANYWSDLARVSTLRRYWAGYLPTAEIVELINRYPGAKPVTDWQVKLMASHLKLRRPKDFGAFWRRTEMANPEVARFRLRGRRGTKEPWWPVQLRPESARKLRKVGRKPKVHVPIMLRRRHTIGLSNVFASIAQRRLGWKRIRARHPTYARNKEIRARHRAGETRIDLAIAYGLALATIVDICTGINHAKIKARAKRVAEYSKNWQRLHKVKRAAKAKAKREADKLANPAQRRPVGRPRAVQPGDGPPPMTFAL